jgi:tetratricopeptide (TPR) repeat protein
MPNTTARNKTTFDENIDTLCDELRLAEKWRRPSILLAMHRSKFGQDKAARVLADHLRKEGRTVVDLVVNNERPDVPRLMSAAPLADQVVFFVSNIDWGGGQDGKAAYRALNLYRELLVENRIKAVFWLTPNEAANLPRYAPDFWAFRHRYLEFASPRAATKAHLPAGLLIWDMEPTVDPFDSLEEKIRAREEILAKLPHNMEALSTRVDLYYTLGHLHWLLGNSGKAAASLTAGLNLTKDHQLPGMRWRLLNGLAVIQYESKDYDRAIETCKEALRDAPPSSTLLINLSAACCMLGRNQEAITIGKRAIKLNPADARIWNRLGYVYVATGKLDEGIACFTKAAELAPRTRAYHESLAVAYGTVERPDQARHQLQIARQIASKEAAFHLDIYEEAMLGSATKAEQLLQAALTAKRIRKHEARRDPNLSVLFGAAKIEALTA